MKSYTDLEQSRKLAEILPLESADMCFNISQRSNMPPLMTPYSKFNEFFNMETPDFLIPCWSLAALLNILNKSAYFINENGIAEISSFKSVRWSASILNCGKIEDCYADNPVDACYEMILKLHEIKML